LLQAETGQVQSARGAALVEPFPRMPEGGRKASAIRHAWLRANTPCSVAGIAERFFVSGDKSSVRCDPCFLERFSDSKQVSEKKRAGFRRL
jgi:hypothetical protein